MMGELFVYLYTSFAEAADRIFINTPSCTHHRRLGGDELMNRDVAIDIPDCLFS